MLGQLPFVFSSKTTLTNLETAGMTFRSPLVGPVEALQFFDTFG